MCKRILTNEIIENFKAYLQREEKSENTIEKYMRDVRVFAEFSSGLAITKELVIEYKRKLIYENYAVSIPKSTDILQCFSL